MALIPLLWLVLTQTREPTWWWLGASFALSWLADTLAHAIDPGFVSAIYPVGQAMIVGALLLERPDARRFVIAIALAGIAAIAVEGFAPSRFLRTVAWLSLAALAFELPKTPLRVLLLTAFGAGWLAWLGYTIVPGWVTWGVYQIVRAMSIAMFCWASRSPAPRLRLA